MPLISTAILAPAEKLVNTALAADSGSRQRLTSIGAGRVLQLRCTRPFPWQLYIRTGEQGLHLLGHFEGEPDCRISGPARALASLATSGRQALYQDDIELSGDTELASGLQQLFTELDIDWEDRLSPLIGDVASHQLGEWARSGRRHSTRTLQQLKRSVEEYLHEEARLFPGRAEIDQFSERLDELRLRLDRIQARLQRLERFGEKRDHDGH